jgi:hypothetical protein
MQIISKYKAESVNIRRWTRFSGRRRRDIGGETSEERHRRV